MCRASDRLIRSARFAAIDRSFGSAADANEGKSCAKLPRARGSIAAIALEDGRNARAKFNNNGREEIWRPR